MRALDRPYQRGMLELTIAPDWRSATSHWDVCLGFLRDHGLDDDEAYALTMSATELLENAVKYGAWEREPGTGILLTVEVEGRAVSVEVHSPVTEDPELLRELDETIEWIRRSADPMGTYVTRLMSASGAGTGPSESGLGLARIAYEACCKLDFYVTSENHLALEARLER